MARKKEYYLKDAQDNFTQGAKMIADLEIDPTNIQALRNAARQAQEAASNLWMLVGIIENGIPSASNASSKGQESEKDRLKRG